MAKLYPCPISFHDDIDNSEKMIFEGFKLLGDDYHIFHSSTWTCRRDGECDFIIFNEQKGFIALEVRSGSINFDGIRWSISETGGKTSFIKDPVKKAQDSMRAFKRIYEDKFNSVLAGICTWGVCFFDYARGYGYRTLDISDSNITDFRDPENIKDWVENLFRVNADYYGVSSLSEAEKNNFLSLFNSDIYIPLSLRRVILEQQRKLASADMMQEYLLDLFEDKSRIVFKGVAGTGKTSLAIKKSIRLASAGKRVLYLCSSRPVNEYINVRLRTYSNIDVMTFYTFVNNVIREYVCFELDRFACENDFFACIDELRSASKINTASGYRQRRGDYTRVEYRIQSAIFSLAGLSAGGEYDSILAEYENRLPLDIIDIISLLIPDDSDNDNFFNTRMPLALSLAFENSDWNVAKYTYDAVMIDEGHDFHKNWCDSLKNLFDKYRHKTVYVFYDENQTIYRRQKELPIRELISRTEHNNYIFKLNDNIRNTSDIHSYAIAKTGLAVSSHDVDIAGIAPEESDFDDSGNALLYTGALLEKLVFEHGIERDNIIILSNRSIGNSIFADSRKAGKFMLSTTGALMDGDTIKYRTIHEFKGLESDVVILLIHKREEEFADKFRYLSEELLYVGLTRARYLLYIINITTKTVTL